jgi:hypothetical protein
VRKSSPLLPIARALMTFRTPLAALVVFASILTPKASADQFVYDFQNYPDLQNGWTLSGQIVTDTDSSNNLSAADILSWNFTLTNGSTSVTGVSTDPSSTITQGMTANAYALTLPISDTIGGGNYLFLNDSLSGAYLQYSRSGPYPLTKTPSYDVYSGDGANGTYQYPGWYDFPATNFSLLTGGQPNDDWTIAEIQQTSTQEPASITLLVSGFLTAGGFGLVRRRRGSATEPTPAN